MCLMLTNVSRAHIMLHFKDKSVDIVCDQATDPKSNGNRWQLPSSRPRSRDGFWRRREEIFTLREQAARDIFVFLHDPGCPGTIFYCIPGCPVLGASNMFVTHTVASFCADGQAASNWQH